ncbi:MAG: hypothetical protein RHS_5774 [Robinsoniella sp. RHS]|nr:MAG: hypothetical protein RHS_5774 [Robinsoniella sp. RHS]
MDAKIRNRQIFEIFKLPPGISDTMAQGEVKNGKNQGC